MSVPQFENLEGAAASGRVVFLNPHISSEKIEELQDGRAIISISRSDIRSVRLRHGFLARHPIAQTFFAIALTTGSSVVLVLAVKMFLRSTIMVVLFLAGCFVVLGFWLIYDALKRGPYLEIWTAKGPQKLALMPRPSAAQLQELARIVGFDPAG